MKIVKRKEAIQPLYLWADLIRVIAIAAVVALHTFELPYSLLEIAAKQNSFISVTSTNLFTLTYLLLAKTGVPLFVILSGALLIQKNESDFIFLKKRITRIFLPWIFWTVIFSVVKFRAEFNTVQIFLTVFSKTLTAEFTFIPVLFCLYFLVPYLRTLLKNTSSKKIFVLLLLWFLSVSFLPYTRDSLAFPWSVDNGLVRQTVVYLGYFIFGYFIERPEIFLVIKKFTPTILVSWVTIISISLFTLTKDSTNYIQILSYSSPLIVSLSFIHFILIKIISEKIEYMNPRIKTLIHFLSRTSFGVFFVHALLTPTVRELVLNNMSTSIGKDFVLVTITIVLSYVIIFALQSFNNFKKFVT